MHYVDSKHPAGLVSMTTGELCRYAWSLQCMDNLKVPHGTRKHWVDGPRVADSVNQTFEKALRTGAAWVVLLCDDLIYPPDLLIHLLDREKDVVIPATAPGLPPHHICAGSYDAGEFQYYLMDSLPLDKGIIKVEGASDGGMLIRRKVIEDTGPPWHAGYSGTKDSIDSEDRTYTKKMLTAGFDVWYDLENPIGHIRPCVVTLRKGEKGYYMDYTSPKEPFQRFE